MSYLNGAKLRHICCYLLVNVLLIMRCGYGVGIAGKAVISASLDGTVRAHDMLRYQNFRTMTTPTPVQLTSLAVDSSGELVCAGALDPFQIFVWSLQTGTSPNNPQPHTYCRAVSM
jgi:WD40 repeat protein